MLFRSALTDILAEKAGALVAVEFDRDLAGILRSRFAENPSVLIHEEDILKVDFASLLGSATFKVVANLPYNISTPVLFRFLEERSRFSRLILMLQKEVGDRLAAPPDCSDYGITTVLFRQWFDIKKEFSVSPGCFVPQPRVESVIISLVPLGGPRVEVGNQQLFERIVKAAFSMRRKTLWNCLKREAFMDTVTLERLLSDAEIEPGRRGETLSIEEFGRISRIASNVLP